MQESTKHFEVSFDGFWLVIQDKFSPRNYIEISKDEIEDFFEAVESGKQFVNKKMD